MGQLASQSVSESVSGSVSKWVSQSVSNRGIASWTVSECTYVSECVHEWICVGVNLSRWVGAMSASGFVCYS